MILEVHESAPSGFAPKVEVAACYLEIEGKLLLLELSEAKAEAGKWGVPAGKIEPGELAKNAAKRELFEETGIWIEDLSQIHSLGALYIRKPGVDYVYHLFRVDLGHLPTIVLSEEHKSYLWASLEDLKSLPLMDGAAQALLYYQLRKNS